MLKKISLTILNQRKLMDRLMINLLNKKVKVMKIHQSNTALKS